MRLSLIFRRFTRVFILTPSLAFSNVPDFPYSPYPICQGQEEKYEVSSMPPIRDQDGTEMCYAFVASALLEQLSCRSRRDITCSHLEQRISVMELARLANQGRLNLSEANSFFKILRWVEGSKVRSVAKELCSPLENLHMAGKVDAPIEGWNEAQKHWASAKSDLSPINLDRCVQAAEKSIPRLAAGLREILPRAAQFEDFQDFATKLLLPEHCAQAHNQINLPKFSAEIFPDMASDPKTLVNQILQLHKKNIPAALNICVHPLANLKCQKNSHHAVVISGVSQCCDQRGCRMGLKIHNSYGMNWQNRYRGGWVDANTLFEAARHSGVPQLTYLAGAQGPVETDLSLNWPTSTPPPRLSTKVFLCQRAGGAPEFRGENGPGCRPYSPGR